MAKPVVNVLAVSLRAGDEHLTPIFMKLLTHHPHLAVLTHFLCAQKEWLSETFSML